jgi:hypothetical protein
MSTSCSKLCHPSSLRMRLIFGICLVAGAIPAQFVKPAYASMPANAGGSAPMESVVYGKGTHDEAPLLDSTDPRARRFFATGQLRIGNGRCTATLISGANPPSSARALILTAGHCVKVMQDNEIIVHGEADPATWSFQAAYFHDNHVVPAYPVLRVLYATMKNEDIAVLELSTTYSEFMSRGITPLKLESHAGAPGAIEIAHIPVNGVPNDQQFMRYSRCNAEDRQRIFESFGVGSSPWFWKQASPGDCAGVAGGTSGSPVVLDGTSKVIGIMNTMADPGFTGCGRGRPCELHGVSYPPDSRKGISYFIPVDIIKNALNDDSTLDVSKLDQGNGVELTRADNSLWISKSQAHDGSNAWNLLIGNDFKSIRYKAGYASTVDCTDEGGYSPEVPAAGQPLRNLSASQAQDPQGIYIMCVVGRRANGTWQRFEDATIKLREIDDTPPPPPSLDVLDHGTSWSVRIDVAGNENVEARMKFGPTNSTDCRSDEGYRFYLGTPIDLQKSQAPWRFCAIGADVAGNPSAPREQDFVQK